MEKEFNQLSAEEQLIIGDLLTIMLRKTIKIKDLIECNNNQFRQIGELKRRIIELENGIG